MVTPACGSQVLSPHRRVSVTTPAKALLPVRGRSQPRGLWPWCPCGLPWALLQGLGSLLSWAGEQRLAPRPRPGDAAAAAPCVPAQHWRRDRSSPWEEMSLAWGSQPADGSCLLLGVLVTRSSGHLRRAVTGGLRGGPVVRTVLSHCRGPGSIPDGELRSGTLLGAAYINK